MKKQFIFILTLLVIGFGCNQNEPDINDLTYNQEFANEIETLYINSNFLNDFKDLVNSSSKKDIANLNPLSFSSASIIESSSNSLILSPHKNLIQAVLFDKQQKSNSRNSSEEIYSDNERKYIDELENAFILLPDLEAFEREIQTINSRIQLEVDDESSKAKLLVISESSKSNAIFWVTNFDNIRSEIAVILHANGRILGDWDWSEFGRETVAGAGAEAVGGAIVGGGVSFGALTVPGWVVGGITGGAGGATSYTLSLA